MIKVGVFWISALLNIDIIYDIETYSTDIDCKEILITYSKQHKDVWEKLSKEQFDGKYSSYKYDTLPRGRVWYDLEEKKYKIAFYSGSKAFVESVTPKILSIFGIEQAEIINGELK